MNGYKRINNSIVCQLPLFQQEYRPAEVQHLKEAEIPVQINASVYLEYNQQSKSIFADGEEYNIDDEVEKAAIYIVEHQASKEDEFEQCDYRPVGFVLADYNNVHANNFAQSVLGYIEEEHDNIQVPVYLTPFASHETIHFVKHASKKIEALADKNVTGVALVRIYPETFYNDEITDKFVLAPICDDKVCIHQDLMDNCDFSNSQGFCELSVDTNNDHFRVFII